MSIGLTLTVDCDISQCCLITDALKRIKCQTDGMIHISFYFLLTIAHLLRWRVKPPLILVSSCTFFVLKAIASNCNNQLHYFVPISFTLSSICRFTHPLGSESLTRPFDILTGDRLQIWIERQQSLLFPGCALMLRIILHSQLLCPSFLKFLRTSDLFT